MSVLHDHYKVRVLIDGKPVEGRAADNAVLVKALAAYAARISFGVDAGDGTVTPVPEGEVVMNDSALVHQNVAAFPDSVRGVIAAVAAVPHSRGAEARRPRVGQEEERRINEERRRRAEAGEVP